YYITDTYNHTLRQLVAATGEVTTLAGSAGQSGSSDGPAATARFNHPQGVAYDHAGHLYIADTDNRSVRQLELSSGVVTTLGLYADSPIQLMAPIGIAAVDGKLYVSEPAANVIYAIDLSAISQGNYKLSILAGKPGSAGITNGDGATALFSYPEGLTADGLGN